LFAEKPLPGERRCARKKRTDFKRPRTRRKARGTQSAVKTTCQYRGLSLARKETTYSRGNLRERKSKRVDPPPKAAYGLRAYLGKEGKKPERGKMNICRGQTRGRELCRATAAQRMSGVGGEGMSRMSVGRSQEEDDEWDASEKGLGKRNMKEFTQRRQPTRADTIPTASYI